MENIILGSAGWRCEYAGKKNILSNSEVKNLILEISNSGIDHIDTAPSYGDAQEIILKLADQTTKIDTKLNKLDGYDDLLNQLKKLELSIERIHTIFFHDPEIVKTKL